MLIGRFSHRGVVQYGVVEPGEESFKVVSGDIFSSFQVTGQEVRIEEAALLTPTTPRIVVGLGRNYYSHIKEMSVAPPDRPAIFFKPAGSMIAHRQPVKIPQWATRVDYEGELGVVIGKKMKGVQEKDVSEYIMGCTCFNDITERHVGSSGLINQDISKCCDTFGPCGPWINTETDPDNAELKTILNGKVVQQDSSANTVFTARRILSELSQFMTLWPGDLVITGTPGGIGPLQAGDIIAVEIAGIGRLSNVVQDDASNRQEYI